MGTFGIKQRSRGEGVVDVLEQMYGVRNKQPSPPRKKVTAAKKKAPAKKKKAAAGKKP